MSRPTWTNEQREAFARDMAQLSSDTLEWLYYQVYDPADCGMSTAIRSVFWERHAVAPERWPTRSIPEYDEPAWMATLGRAHLIACCPKSAGHQDPAHQPVKQMTIPRDGGGNASTFECSCGKRTSEWELRVEQVRGSALVWPTIHVDGVCYFVVCREAKHAEDPRHAPNGITTDADFNECRQCLCRYPLNSKYTKNLAAQ